MVLSIVFMIVICAVGVLFMYKAVSGRLKSNKAKSWPTVPGRVLTSEVIEDRFRNATGKASIAYVPDVTFEYNVNGTSYTSKNVIFGETTYDYLTASRICEKYAVDTTPPVYYNPERPSEAVLAPWSTEGARSFIPGIFFIVAGLLVGLFGILFPS